jgi:hypothetical protein
MDESDLNQCFERLVLLERESKELQGIIRASLGGEAAQSGQNLVVGGSGNSKPPILVAYDTETPYTGGPTKNKTLLQVAAVPLQEEHPTFEAVVPDESNVTPEDEAACLSAFFLYILRLEERVVLLAHNGKRFDSHVIIGAARRCGVQIPPNLYGHLDTLDVLRALRPDSKTGHSLDSVCALYNVKIKNRHTALGDAVALAETMRIASEDSKWISTSRRLFETQHAAALRVDRVKQTVRKTKR